MQLGYTINNASRMSMFFPTLSATRYLNIFWISVVLYSSGYAFSTSLSALAAIFQGLQIIGIFGMFFSLANLASVQKLNIYFLLLFIVYILWQLFFVLRGNFEDVEYEQLKSFFFDGNYGLFCLFVPLTGLLPVTLFNVKKLFDACFISFFLYLLFTILVMPVLFHPDPNDAVSREAFEASVKFLAFPVGFVLLTFDLQSNRRKLFALLVFSVVIFFALFRARRGILMISGIVAVFAFTFYFFRSSNKLGWILGVIYLLILGYQFYLVEYSFSKITFLGNIFERGLENTRSYVEECFFSSMSTLDWIIGKGYNRGYHCPGIDDAIFKGGMRTVIETDYLQLILTGGLVNLMLLLAIVLPAVYLGLFHSSNLFCKKAATWIIIWLFFLYPSNGYTFSIFHISMWLMVAICYNDNFRSLTNQTIINYFTKEINLTSSEKA